MSAKSRRCAHLRTKFICCLTEKGVYIVPIMIELILWGANHCATIVAPGLLAEFQTGKDVAVEKYQRLAREKALA
jgi:hypothetical protein